ncbi:hypothetical protein [Azospirillum sp. B4]|uniref:hypothetical protein n=1 Tax=Azospirillum sp. B4 TaxID=95605 RepID=UPI0005CB1CF2|nr:hypothetical protein [Azospirillum sp. B4]
MIRMIVSQSFLWMCASILLCVVPQTLLSWFGIPPVAYQDVLARLFGSELAGLAMVSYFTRQLAHTPRRKYLAAAYSVSNTLGFITTFSAVISGMPGIPILLLSVLYLVYAIFFIYHILRGGDFVSERPGAPAP